MNSTGIKTASPQPHKRVQYKKPKITEMNSLNKKVSVLIANAAYSPKDLINFLKLNVESLVNIENYISMFMIDWRYNSIKVNSNVIIDYFRTFKYYKIGSIVLSWFSNDNDLQTVLNKLLNIQVLSFWIIYLYLTTVGKEGKSLKIVNMLNDVVMDVHQSFLILCNFWWDTLNKQKLENAWSNKLADIIIKKTIKRIPQISRCLLIKAVTRYNDTLITKLNNIVKTNKQIYCTSYIDAIKLSHITQNKWYLAFFQDQVKLVNKEIMFYDNYIDEDDSDSWHCVASPFWDEWSPNQNYKWTVVLDWDETWIHFQMDESNEKGILKMRPLCIEFLEGWKALNCEWVIFTASTQTYADPIIDAIENEVNYFVRRLYRQHSVIINNTFMKDLSKWGRSWDKTVIVDNTSQNYELQKANGILIKSFYGEDINDNKWGVWLDFFKTLINNGYQDIKKELAKQKDYIASNISC